MATQHRFRPLIVAALALVAVLACARMEAQTPPTWVAWEFQGENDALVVDGTDEFYTNGVRFSMQRNPERLSAGTVAFGERLWNVLHPQKDVVVGLGFEIGQNLFTPEDLQPTELIVDDRPYAGWLYGGVLLTLTEDAPGVDDIVQQTLEFQLGIVGPEAGGEAVQTEAHELLDDALPMGWDNQLPFEIGVNAFYTWRKRFVLGRRGGRPFFDVVPHLGGALGTMQIFVNAGGTVRLGYNISGFPVAQIQNTVTLLPGVSRPAWEGYVFLGVDGRAIARNIFLDGSTFRDSHSVDKRNFVVDFEAGLSLRYRSCRLTYTVVSRSQEFSPLPMNLLGTDGRHEFGTINFTVERNF